MSGREGYLSPYFECDDEEEEERTLRRQTLQFERMQNDGEVFGGDEEGVMMMETQPPPEEIKMGTPQLRYAEEAAGAIAPAAVAQSVRMNKEGAGIFASAAAVPAPKNSPQNTIINGKGLWNSWTRNFSTPLLALCDLLDNAFDAATWHQLQVGKILIQADKHLSRACNRQQASGIVITNNSVLPIKPLQQVLEVYTSLKGAGAESIGENGVGLKQGCATLSDLSFCLVRNKKRYSLGVLAWSLQTDTQCSLPCFDFQSSEMNELHAEMHRLFQHDYPQVGACVKAYGHGHLETGIDRLVKRFSEISSTFNEGWAKYDNVFSLIVHHLRHGADFKEESLDSIGSDTESQHNQVAKLLDNLYEDLPVRYLHIPDALEVRVGGKRVNFHYWQPRLVEMAQFDLKINKEVPLHNDPNWKNPDVEDSDHIYTMRVYFGFDALRVVDNSDHSTASVYIYSRQLGRLIKRYDDGRRALGLTATGTDYSQGLTIILDDRDAHLPLNPTKQDVAFGKQANGETHWNNLETWASAATRLYYQFYKDQICQGQKGLLTESLRTKVPEVKALVSSSQSIFRSLANCQFTSFGEFASAIQKKKLRLIPIKSVDYFLGPDTKLRLPPVPASAVPLTQKKSPPLSSQKKRARSPEETTDQTVPGKNALELELEDKCKRMKRHIKSEQAAHKDEIAQKDEEIELLKTENERLKANNNRLKAENEMLKSQPEPVASKKARSQKDKIRILERENDDKTKQIAGLQETIQSKDEIIALLRRHIDEFDEDPVEDTCDV